MPKRVTGQAQQWNRNKYGQQIGTVVRRMVREADFFNEMVKWMRQDLRNMPPNLLIRLLEYGYGKPPERIEVTGEFTEGNTPVDFSQMTEEEALAKQRELVVGILQRIDAKQKLLQSTVEGETVQ